MERFTYVMYCLSCLGLMNDQINRLNKRPPLRKRLRRDWTFPFIIKQYAWRITAAWCWLYAVATLFGLRSVTKSVDQHVAMVVIKVLAKAGFAPANLPFQSALLKVFWVFAISSFSWVQVLGLLFLYIPFSPLLLIFRKRRKEYRKTRAESFEKARREGVDLPRSNISLVLLFLLFAWFVLYAGTSQHYPLIIAMILTGLLFIARINRALIYAATIEFPRKNRTAVFLRASQKFVKSTFDNFKEGKIDKMADLNRMIRLASWTLRLSRFVSVWLYGRATRTRASLIVLIRFMANLAILGCLSVLFWGFVIKYFAVRQSSERLTDALLASASRVIPGIPDSSSIHVSAGIQTLASLTAWLIFVLYAGPVASLFPAFQERVIAQTSESYARIRTARKILYRFVTLLRTLQQLFIDHPELIPFAQNILLLRKQANVREFLLTQPDYVRSLVGKTEEIELMQSLGVQIPDIEELIRDLPKSQI
jgi:hypothetical protein